MKRISLIMLAFLVFMGGSIRMNVVFGHDEQIETSINELDSLSLAEHQRSAYRESESYVEKFDEGMDDENQENQVINSTSSGYDNSLETTNVKYRLETSFPNFNWTQPTHARYTDDVSDGRPINVKGGDFSSSLIETALTNSNSNSD